MKPAQHSAVKAARKHRHGAISTRCERARTVKRIVGDIVAKFPGLQLENLGKRHVLWWIDAMRRGKLSRGGRPPSIGSQKNDLAALRFLLRRIGKPNLLPKSNADLGVERRDCVRTVSVAIELQPEQVAKIYAHSPRYAICLQLMSEFGLRVEESLKIVPMMADRGFELELRGSWCKNGRARGIPILRTEQRVILEQAKTIAGQGSLIPPGLNYAEARGQLQALTTAIGLNHRHALRHGYAASRYLAMTGALPPVATGLTRADVTAEQVLLDRAARSAIALELGHARRSVLGAYLGSLFRSRRE